MTDDKQPKQQADEEPKEQADLELDEEQTDDVKGGSARLKGTPDQESGRRNW